MADGRIAAAVLHGLGFLHYRITTTLLFCGSADPVYDSATVLMRVLLRFLLCRGVVCCFVAVEPHSFPHL